MSLVIPEYPPIYSSPLEIQNFVLRRFFLDAQFSKWEMAIHKNLALHKRNQKKRHDKPVSPTVKNIGQKKNVWEIPRKLFHSSIGFPVLYLYSTHADALAIRNVLAILFVMGITADLLRFNIQWFNTIYIKIFGFLMREVEKRDKINGVVFYLAGCILVLSIFPQDIAAISILILSWCDTAASCFGRAFGHLTYKFSSGKSVAGTLGAILTGCLAAYVFWGGWIDHKDIVRTPSWQPEKSVLSLPVLILLTGIIGGSSELVDVWGLDDNFVIPVVAGCLLWVILIGFGFGGI
ncbi:10508_t:CDS:2 [Paraglomus occultum]|uniref:10508_t:CDS:1 n=1 Tax=Paraglomus occultum TaxID=144539 RepID=A0A9N8Z6F3_9GLOM|nr:10508_t:CDS:2 [Paraglomus occultum]